MGATWSTSAGHDFVPGVRIHGHAAAFAGFVRMADLDTAQLKRRFAQT